MTVVEERVRENPAGNCLSPEEIREIEAKGYEIGPKIGLKLGEGNEKAVYVVKYTQGRVEKTRVMEVPKREISGSVTTAINKSRGCNTRSEVVASNSIQHPNVVEIVDSVDLGDRTINFTEYHEGSVDLETLINRGGPLRNEERIRKIINQAIAGMSAIHSKSYVHRDIKPSNIILTGEGIVKIGDLSTAKKQWDIIYNSVPTRGGTAYAHPRLLNALLSNEETAASKDTDRYSLGATILFLLTGKTPTDYSTVQTEQGREIEIDEDKVKVGVTSGETPLSKIDRLEHERQLRATVKSVPKELREYAEFAYRCMTDKKGFVDDEEMEGAFENIGKGSWKKFKEGVAKGVRYVLPSMAAAAVVGLAAWGIATRDPEPKPTLCEILRSKHYANFSLESRLGEGLEREYILDILVPYMEEAKKKILKLTKKDQREIDTYAQWGRDIHGLNKRLVASWLMADYLLKEEGERGYKNEKEERLSPSFVPEKFAIMNQHPRGRSYPEFDARAAVAQGSMYLKMCIGHDKDVSEVYADYFSNREDINTAKARTHSTDFLPRIRENGVIEIGYGKFLPYHEKRLAEMATALYLITDEEGKVDFTKIPKRNQPDGTYRSMIHLPEY